MYILGNEKTKDKQQGRAGFQKKTMTRGERKRTAKKKGTKGQKTRVLYRPARFNSYKAHLTC